MINLEDVVNAKKYLDMLANGINPISGLPVAETDVVNDVKISRCLFYVSGVLQKIIDYDGICVPRKCKKPFYITDEQLSGYEYSDTPICVTQVTDKINSLLNNDTVKPLYFMTVLNGLKKLGYLEDANGRFGKAKTCPTEEGKRLGISIKKYTTRHGETYVNYYDRNAQEFIINNIKYFIKYNQLRKRSY